MEVFVCLSFHLVSVCIRIKLSLIQEIAVDIK